MRKELIIVSDLKQQLLCILKNNNLFKPYIFRKDYQSINDIIEATKIIEENKIEIIEFSYPFFKNKYIKNKSIINMNTAYICLICMKYNNTKLRNLIIENRGYTLKLECIIENLLRNYDKKKLSIKMIAKDKEYSSIDTLIKEIVVFEHEF